VAVAVPCARVPVTGVGQSAGPALGGGQEMRPPGAQAARGP
jgi:hypothetical protein